MSITSNLPALWNRGNITNYSAYAHGCTNALNYHQAVINGWA